MELRPGHSNDRQRCQVEIKSPLNAAEGANCEEIINKLLVALNSKQGYDAKNLDFTLTRDSIFCSMIKWVFKEIYADLPRQINDSCECLSSKIFPHEKTNQYVCMIEFHHLLPPRVDLSFHVMSTLSSMSTIELPPWWSAHLEKCDHTSRNSFIDTCETRNIKKFNKNQASHNKTLPYRLPCDHFLEFDLHGDSVELGGIFQRIERLSGDNRLDDFYFFQILDRLPGFTRSEFRNELGNKPLAQLTKILGLPVQLGLMVGRGELIKLVYKAIDKNVWQEESENYCQSLLQYFSQSFVENFRQIITAFNCIPDISFRLCLDLALVKCFDSPRFCVEIFPDSGVKETRSHKLLYLLQDTFMLEQANVHHVINLHRELPKGYRRIPGGSPIPGCEDERIYSIAATLSHYKIEFPLDCSPKLKTYVNITSEIFYT